VWGWSPTLGRVGDLESSGTLECSELDSKAQNTSHWSVLGVIGKVLKSRYRKCPRIENLDVYRASYGQKKGRESNWQFDSRPLKVRNRPLPEVRIGSVIRRWKDLDEGYKFGSVPIWLPTTKSRESTSSRSPNRECDTSLERSRRGLQVRFRPRRDPISKSGVMSSQSPGTPPGTISGQLRDSISGVPGIGAIWM
jgi:hypothetical protein